MSEFWHTVTQTCTTFGASRCATAADLLASNPLLPWTRWLQAGHWCRLRLRLRLRRSSISSKRPWEWVQVRARRYTILVSRMSVLRSSSSSLCTTNSRELIFVICDLDFMFSLCSLRLYVVWALVGVQRVHEKSICMCKDASCLVNIWSYMVSYL